MPVCVNNYINQKNVKSLSSIAKLQRCGRPYWAGCVHSWKCICIFSIIFQCSNGAGIRNPCYIYARARALYWANGYWCPCKAMSNHGMGLVFKDVFRFSTWKIKAKVISTMYTTIRWWPFWMYICILLNKNLIFGHTVVLLYVCKCVFSFHSIAFVGSGR